MSRLFIIGNGFDVAHGLPSTYGDYKNYIINTYKPSDEYVDGITDFKVAYKDEYRIDIGSVARFLYHFINHSSKYENWCDFEAILGNLNYSYAFDIMGFETVFDKEHDKDCSKTAYNREDIANNILEACRLIGDVFSQWINAIDVSKAKVIEGLTRIIENDSLFLNFNYTNLLQSKYNISDEHICHIHGRMHKNIIVGHGLSEKEMNVKYKMFIDRYTGAEDCFDEVLKLLRKNTDDIINENFDFFDCLEEVTEIYSYGFSFSKVDLPYIRQICDSVDTRNVIWYQNDYNFTNGNDFSKIIRGCGFKGEIGVFHC